MVVAQVSDRGRGQHVMPLSILLFYDCVYPDSVGGVEHRNYELARALAARGHRVTLAGFCAERSMPFERVEILPVGRPGRLYNAGGKRSSAEALRLALGAARIDLAPFDVIESANIPYAHLPVLAARCRLRQKPFVVTWHEYWGRYWASYVGWKWPLYAAIERVTAPLGTEVCAVSRLTANRVQTQRGKSVRVIPNGVPVLRIRDIAARAASGAGPPLVYAGRLLREKRLHLLLEAVARLAVSARWSSPVLAVLGDGPDRERLIRLAADLGIEQAVRFHGSLPTSAEVWHHIAQSRIAVQPSSREGFGLFPLEAMAAGLPVVYCESSESAIGELVHAGVDGVCTAADPDALAAGLEALLSDHAEVRRLGGNAGRHAERFDWSAVAAEVERLFQEVSHPDLLHNLPSK
jgi:glycosyltransferase involved in cell wall biosynthesis